MCKILLLHDISVYGAHRGNANIQYIFTINLHRYTDRCAVHAYMRSCATKVHIHITIMDNQGGAY